MPVEDLVILGQDVEIQWPTYFEAYESDSNIDRSIIILNHPDPAYKWFESNAELQLFGQQSLSDLTVTWNGPEGMYQLGRPDSAAPLQLPAFKGAGVYDLSISNGGTTVSRLLVAREYDGARIRLYDFSGRNITDLGIGRSLTDGKAAVIPGDILTVRYEGFPPESTVTVGLYGESSENPNALELLDEWKASTDADGVFTEDLLFPLDTDPGLYRLVACPTVGCREFQDPSGVSVPEARTSFEIVSKPPGEAPAESEPTPVAAPDIDPGQLARISTSADLQELWLRNRAGNNRRTLDVLSPNSLVEIVGQPTRISGESWYKVQWEDQIGWLKAAALLSVEQIPSVPYWRLAWTRECDTATPVALALMLSGDEDVCGPGVETWDLQTLASSLLDQKLLRQGEQLQANDKGEIMIRRDGKTVGRVSIEGEASETLARIDERANNQVGPTCQLHTDYSWECR
jgi:hypothetical protein